MIDEMLERTAELVNKEKIEHEIQEGHNTEAYLLAEGIINDLEKENPESLTVRGYVATTTEDPNHPGLRRTITPTVKRGRGAGVAIRRKEMDRYPPSYDIMVAREDGKLFSFAQFDKYEGKITYTEKNVHQAGYNEDADIEVVNLLREIADALKKSP